MDDADRAQIEIEREQERLHARARARRFAPPVTHCLDCGDEIPKARREAAPWASKCVQCARRDEQRGNKYA